MKTVPVHKVFQYDLDANLIASYERYKDAAEAVNGDIGNIHKSANGKCGPVYGYAWVYKHSEKKSRKERPSKTLKIYRKLSDKEIRQWYSAAQLVTTKYFMIKTMSDILILDKEESIRKREMLIQTDDYKYHLKLNKDEFYGVKYQVEKFYNVADVTLFIKSAFVAKTPWRTQKVPQQPLKNLTTHLSDRRALESLKEAPIQFFGEQRTGLVSKSETFRLYYGIFFQKPYIDYLFQKHHNVTANFMGALLHLFVYKFFKKRELKSYFRYRNMGNQLGPGASWQKLYEDGWIVRYKGKNSVFKKKGGKHYLYMVTDKTIKFCELYMDYVLFRKKIPYTGHSLSDVKVVLPDVKEQTLDNSKKAGTKPLSYILYDQIYQWTNYMAEIKYTDDLMFEQVKKMSSADFAFNPYIWAIAEKDLMADGPYKNNERYIKRFLNQRRFGVSVNV